MVSGSGLLVAALLDATLLVAALLDATLLAPALLDATLLAPALLDAMLRPALDLWLQHYRVAVGGHRLDRPTPRRSGRST